MGVPKRRTSKARKNSRRSTFKLGSQMIMECPHCHEPKLAHQICTACGYYRDMEVIAK